MKHGFTTDNKCTPEEKKKIISNNDQQIDTDYTS